MKEKLLNMLYNMSCCDNMKCISLTWEATAGIHKFMKSLVN